MTPEEVKKIVPGIYRIFWADNHGMSVAAVGVDPAGNHWLAPTNWVNPTHSYSQGWSMVEKVELITTQRMEQYYIDKC